MHIQQRQSPLQSQNSSFHNQEHEIFLDIFPCELIQEIISYLADQELHYLDISINPNRRVGLAKSVDWITLSEEGWENLANRSNFSLQFSELQLKHNEGKIRQIKKMQYLYTIAVLGFLHAAYKNGTSSKYPKHIKTNYAKLLRFTVAGAELYNSFCKSTTSISKLSTTNANYSNSIEKAKITNQLQSGDALIVALAIKPIREELLFQAIQNGASNSAAIYTQSILSAKAELRSEQIQIAIELAQEALHQGDDSALWIMGNSPYAFKPILEKAFPVLATSFPNTLKFLVKQFLQSKISVDFVGMILEYDHQLPSKLSCELLGLCARSSIKDALSELIKKAQLDCIEAQVALGKFYAETLEIKPSAVGHRYLKETIYYFSLAAERNHPDALLYLARYYLKNKNYTFWIENMHRFIKSKVNLRKHYEEHSIFKIPNVKSAGSLI